jgi:hypothetical protein
VRAWAAVQPASAESRFDALHATGLTELVGREEQVFKGGVLNKRVLEPIIGIRRQALREQYVGVDEPV